MTSRRMLLRVLERERLAFQEERRLLLDTVCRLAGQPVAPSDMDMWKLKQAEFVAASALRRAEEAREMADDLVDPADLPDYELA